MTEKDFAALLGRGCQGDKGININKAIEHMQGALFVMMPNQQEADPDLCGSTVVAWRDSEILLKDSEGKLYRVAPDDENRLEIDQDGYEAYYLLINEGALDRVLNPVAVAELQRLQAEAVEESSLKGRDRERAEYERLKAEYGCD